MDSNGLADPYVKLHLLPGASKVPYGPALSASWAHRPWRAPRVPSSGPTVALSAPSPSPPWAAKALRGVRGAQRSLSLKGQGSAPFSNPETWDQELPKARCPKEADAPKMPFTCSSTSSSLAMLATDLHPLPF